MRVLFIIALFASASLRASTGCDNSTLRIRTDLHRPIKVYVDGTTGNNPPSVGVTVNGITPGVHHLRVVETHINRYGEEVRKTVYNGSVDIRASMYIDARVDENRGIALHNTYVPCDQQNKALNLVGDVIDGDDQQNTNNQKNNTTTNNTITPPPAPALPAHMTDGDFQALVNTVITAKYEVKKQDTLKAALGTARVSTDQVRQLMALFSFESNKLDVAKMLYDHTVDKQNYGSLTASFNFETNKAAFKKFLSAK